MCGTEMCAGVRRGTEESEEKVKARFSAIAERPVTYATLCAPKDIWADLALIERLAEP